MTTPMTTRSHPRSLRPSLVLVAAGLVFSSSCAPGDGDGADAAGAPSAEALAAVQAPATFRGTLPCADCPGIRTTLDLTADGSATVHRRYIEGEPDRDPEFTETGRWTVDDGGRVVVTGDDGSVSYFAFDRNGLAALDRSGMPLPSDLPRVLARVPDSPMAELAGTAWRFVEPAAAEGDAAVAVPTLRFAADGRLTGSDGCNALTGPWRVGDDGGLTLGPLASTRRACPGQGDAVARAVGTAVTATAAYRLTADVTLELLDAGGATVARLRPAP